MGNGDGVATNFHRSANAMGKAVDLRGQVSGLGCEEGCEPAMLGGEEAGSARYGCRRKFRLRINRPISPAPSRKPLALLAAATSPVSPMQIDFG
jgi:hypothetical protein